MGLRNQSLFLSTLLVPILCVIYYYNFRVGDNVRIIAKISNGKLLGYQLDGIHAFESIPYAEPPINENRFEPPKPYTIKWSDIRNAKGLPTSCMQWSEFTDSDDHLMGVEDCLYLNVYSPNINNDELYPVLIYIHGGAFMHGGTKLLDSYLVRKEKNFVYVTLNYRLGPLGFISTEDEQIPGNMGLKDQQMAIKWVKNNIKAFKGDPEQIIISGFSAGGASVHYHLMSKKTEGLVAAAVSHSGSALCPWAFIENPLMRTKKLSAHIGCPTDNTKKMKDCLKLKDAEDIVRAVDKFMVFLSNPFTVFGPVVEPKLNNKEPFLVEKVKDLIRSGKTAKIPWLLGYTVDEGVYNGAYLMKKDENGVEMIEQLDSKWDEIAPTMLFFNESIPVEEHVEFGRNYKRKYLYDERISKNTYWNIQNMLTDRYFLEGIQTSIELHRDYSKSPVYVYAFDHPAPINLGQIMSGRDDIFFGTGHGDDVYLIFATKFVRSPETFTKIEQIISKKLIGLYENFVKTGIPKYGDVVIPKNVQQDIFIKLIRIKGTQAIYEHGDRLI